MPDAKSICSDRANVGLRAGATELFLGGSVIVALLVAGERRTQHVTDEAAAESEQTIRG